MEVTQFTSWWDASSFSFEKLAPLGQHGAEYQRRPPDGRWILDRRALNVQSRAFLRPVASARLS